MKVWLVCDYGDCEEHGVKGVFSSPEIAYEAFAVKGMSKKECHEFAKDYFGHDDFICKFEGEPPYEWCMTSPMGNKCVMYFETVEENSLGGYALEEVEMNTVLDRLIG